MLFQIDEEKDLDEDLKKEEISANSESTDDVQENAFTAAAAMSFKVQQSTSSPNTVVSMSEY